MDQSTSSSPGTSPDTLLPPPSGRPPAPARKRSSSGAGGLLSKLPFIRSTGDHHRPRSRRNTIESDPAAPMPTLPIPSFITIPADDTAPPSPLPHILQQHRTSDQPQQQKTRRRRGSLRKVALLGRGAQRERREGRTLSIDTKLDTDGGRDGTSFETIIAATETITSSPTPIDRRTKVIPILQYNGDDLSKFGLGISDATPRPSMDTPTVHHLDAAAAASDPDATPIAGPPPIIMPSVSRPAAAAAAAPDTSPSINYSTTDDEDALHMARSNTSSSSLPNPRLITPSLSLPRPECASLSSGSDFYFNPRPAPAGGATATAITGSVGESALQRRRSATSQRAKSPLALAPLAAPLSVAPDPDWDYAETEWWGWIILVVTWTVFVVGMGSCLGVWSWAWDVGTTPYAPPELEDDPTLPIVGYYPALLILTGVMAWVWVVVAWTGMKYFRHAQVSKD
ncbi:hypothetical protein C8A05DRAFT_35176 [Staphylotrichum tortipilum]|uniref:Uncharacterized protein n=1 Tax=Staphylotrichum tortipilum TaxID=2831512 RepID=A0AAN6MHV9_9PEZI|nr:hypothetical protein C8A05DRAFT_35176 [Staphylotrichum longicolle]